jgi:hypothetical protein
VFFIEKGVGYNPRVERTTNFNERKSAHSGERNRG